MDFDEIRKSCENNIRKYKRLLRRYDPSNVDPDTVKRYDNKWNEEVSAALDVELDSIESMILDQWNSKLLIVKQHLKPSPRTSLKS